MKILIFGGNGQLGLELQKRALDLEFEIVSPVQSELDITDQPQVSFLANRIAPNLIINAAAYTAVDQAEAEHERAYSVNRDGAAVVAIAARDVRARLIHVSTDYVFDGEGRLPLDEGAPTNPINVYGASKLDGEREVLRILADKALVVRTSSLHGAKGQRGLLVLYPWQKYRQT